MARCRFTFEDGPNGEMRVLGESDPRLDMRNLPDELTLAQQLFVAMATVIESEADEVNKDPATIVENLTIITEN